MKLADLTRLQTRFLRGHVCWLCEMPLDRDYCGTIQIPRCPPQVMERRRADCLKTYKPRHKEARA